MLQTHLFCFLASYIVALLLEIARLWTGRIILRWGSLAFTVAGVMAHIWYLLARSRAVQLPPLLASMQDWCLVSALLLVGIYVVYSLVDYQRKGYSSLGLFVLPVSILLIGAASFVQSSPNGIEAERFWIMLHTSSLSIGITGVLIGFLFSVMYLIQHRRLKRKIHLKRGFELPPLASLARYNRWMVIGSFPMLTVGLVTGIQLVVRNKRESSPAFWADPIILSFSILWVGMVVLFLWLLKAQPTQGRQVAILTAWSCGFLVITLVSLLILVSVLGLPSQHGGMLP